MELFFIIYIYCWASLCVSALFVYIRNRDDFALSHRDYWMFLFRPWKLTTFFIAGSGLTILAPYGGDYTWDYFDSIFMSVLAFCTAPWVVGLLYKAFYKKVSFKQLFVALCVLFFSTSWSYDLYIFMRDGKYTELWFLNIFVSSVLYTFAGLFWNLEWRQQRGIIFSFMEDDWPNPRAAGSFSKIIWPAFLFMAVACMLVLQFFL